MLAKRPLHSAGWCSKLFWSPTLIQPVFSLMLAGHVWFPCNISGFAVVKSTKREKKKKEWKIGIFWCDSHLLAAKMLRFFLKHSCVLQWKSSSFKARRGVKQSWEQAGVLFLPSTRGSGLILSTLGLLPSEAKNNYVGEFAKLRLAEVGFLPPKGHFQLWNSCSKCHSLQIVFKRYSKSHPPQPPSRPSPSHPQSLPL